MRSTTQILATAVAVAIVAAAGPVAAQTRVQAPTGTGTPAAAPANAGTAASVATATRFLDRFDAGDYEAARADFSAEMLAALDAGKLATVGTQLAQAGKAGVRSAPRVMQQEGYDVVVFTIDRGAAMVDATISVDGEGKVAGVYFLPAQPEGAPSAAGD